MLTLALAFVPGSAGAQTPGPAKPANLTAYPANTEGEIILHWDASEGAAHYRVCRRPADGAARWGCFDSPDNSALLTRLQVGVPYYFAVAAGGEYLHSSWAWTEAVVGIPEVARCPVTGLPIPDGYLSVGENTTHVSGRIFSLTGIVPKGGITQGESDFPPLASRQYVEVCGKVTAPAGVEVHFRPGIDNNLFTDRGMGFRVPDDRVTDWSEVGRCARGQDSHSALRCLGSSCRFRNVVYYAVNNWLENPGRLSGRAFP